MSCSCGKGCFDGLSEADANVLKVLRAGGLSSLSTVEFELLVQDVVKAGGVRLVGGTAGRAIRDAVAKAEFGDRSAAARYAAEQRWKGHVAALEQEPWTDRDAAVREWRRIDALQRELVRSGRTDRLVELQRQKEAVGEAISALEAGATAPKEAIDFPEAEMRRMSGLTTAVVGGRERTYRGSDVKAREVRVGDLVGGESEATPNEVLAVVVPAEAADRAGRPMRLIVAPVNRRSARSSMSLSPNRSLVRWVEVAEKAFGGAAPYMDRSSAGRYAAEQRWKGHVSAAEVRQQQRGKGGAAGGGGNGGVPVKSAQEAIDAMAQGKRVVIEASQVYTVLAELAKFAQEAKAKGKDAPDLDLCKVSVPNTNLFCGENVGLTRDQMPQLSGKPKAGSKADKMPKDDKGRADLAKPFIDHLAAKGVKTVEGEVKASSLRASQNQLIGADVAGIMGAIESGKMKDQTLFVSRDGYVIDGHHRWAATVGLDYKDGDGEDIKMKVRVIDMPIREVLAAAVEFADDMGIPRRSGDVKEDARTKLED